MPGVQALPASRGGSRISQYGRSLFCGPRVPEFERSRKMWSCSQNAAGEVLVSEALRRRTLEQFPDPGLDTLVAERVVSASRSW